MVGQGQLGVDVNGLLVVGSSLVMLAFVIPEQAPVVVGLGKAGIEPDRCVEVYEGFIVRTFVTPN
jgi:hypothetical protein